MLYHVFEITVGNKRGERRQASCLERRSYGRIVYDVTSLEGIAVRTSWVDCVSRVVGWGCYPLQLCSRSRIAVPTAMLYCKVDTAVQREHIEHVRVTEGVEYMRTLAWGWATFLSGRWPIVRDTRDGVSYA